MGGGDERIFLGEAGALSMYEVFNTENHHQKKHKERLHSEFSLAECFLTTP